ncbi:DUF2778 domain-containing protein [Mesorhizobium sp. BE184]|uniref:DUF2778 domain-containing protein n=1 Tax=Mesorhizobium sp. BE184 TaxID=2817714 RepID=UPI0028556FE7|nr:DUF2778 domain-containing protein [Mesorhizobium sp. BE184]MDR7035089.1 hypothetical protein [Mesorhizobium sp. BE184]
MAYLFVKGGRSASGSTRKPAGYGSVLRWAVIPAVGAGLVLWSLAMMAGLSSAANTLASDLNPHALPSSTLAALSGAPRHSLRLAGAQPVAKREARVLPGLKPSGVEKSVRLASLDATPLAHIQSAAERFDRKVTEAALSPAKLAAVFAQADMVLASAEPAPPPMRERFSSAISVHGAPEASRFGPGVTETVRSSRLALALAAAGEVEVALAYPTATASDVPDGIFVSPLEPVEAEGDTVLLAAIPEAAPLPTRRPKLTETARAEAAPSNAARPDAGPRIAEAAKPARKPAEKPKQEMLAFARPDNPDGGGIFKKLFSAPRPRKDTAIYDISAQTVYMPDGTRLEAHSGIGRMVDNVAYIGVKNLGPTPPDTYRMVMRESRFYGVEAIRLLPVDGKTKHGRDGLLAHSYLLRGGAAQSHGCVAFKDYPKFLKAFKAGKVKYLVVVAGRGGRSQPATRMARNGNDA